MLRFVRRIEQRDPHRRRGEAVSRRPFRQHAALPQLDALDAGSDTRSRGPKANLAVQWLQPRKRQRHLGVAPGRAGA